MPRQLGAAVRSAACHASRSVSAGLTAAAFPGLRPALAACCAWNVEGGPGADSTVGTEAAWDRSGTCATVRAALDEPWPSEADNLCKTSKEVAIGRRTLCSSNFANCRIAFDKFCAAGSPARRAAASAAREVALLLFLPGVAGARARLDASRARNCENLSPISVWNAPHAWQPAAAALPSLRAKFETCYELGCDEAGRGEHRVGSHHDTDRPKEMGFAENRLMFTAPCGSMWLWSSIHASTMVEDTAQLSWRKRIGARTKFDKPRASNCGDPPGLLNQSPAGNGRSEWAAFARGRLVLAAPRASSSHRTARDTAAYPDDNATGSAAGLI